MYKVIRIIIMLFLVAGFLYAGIPLQRESAAPNFVLEHPDQSQRCGAIGDLSSFLTCSATSPHLRGLALLATVVDHINLATYPFGYIFILVLPLLLVLVMFLI